MTRTRGAGAHHVRGGRALREVFTPLRTDTLAALQHLHNEHGDTFLASVAGHRFAFLRNGDDIVEVLSRNADNVEKGLAARIARIVLGRGLVTGDGESYRRHRRLMQPLFTPRNLRAHEREMSEIVNAEIGAWLPDSTIDLDAEMSRIALLVFGTTMYGLDVTGDLPRLNRAVGDAKDCYLHLVTHPLLPVVQHVPFTPTMRKLRRAARGLDAVIHDLISRERGSVDERIDLLGLLQRANTATGGDAALNDRELRDEALILLLGGFDTTAATLMLGIWQLARDPALAQRLRADLAAHAVDGEVSAEQLRDIPSLRAFLLETLRMYPPIPVIPRRVLHTPIELSNCTLQPGTEVVCSIWSAHRRADVWPDPDVFDIDRFLDDRLVADRPKSAFLSFGAGPRTCIGKEFALLEMAHVIAAVLLRWQLDSDTTRLPPLEAAFSIRATAPVTVRVSAPSAETAPSSTSI